jgi:RimJ/RimL family protein N-acetyltransferase
MRPPEEFETSRLHLRVPVPDDAVAVFEQYGQDADVAKYVTWKPHRHISETDDFLNRCIRVWQDGSAFVWVIIRKADDQLLGMVEIQVSGFKAEMGYVLAKAYWGKGYMPKAAQAVVNWAMEQDEIFRVGAVCDVDNPASARVMEKVGMQKEGVLKRWIMHPNISTEPRDCLCYALVK